LLPGITRPEGLSAYREGTRLDEALLSTQRRYEDGQ
jgi:hypothetical protein